MSIFWKGIFEMKKHTVREEDDTNRFLELYEHLSGQGQEMANIVLKIGSSKILTDQEFDILIKNLMRPRS